MTKKKKTNCDETQDNKNSESVVVYRSVRTRDLAASIGPLLQRDCVSSNTNLSIGAIDLVRSFVQPSFWQRLSDMRFSNATKWRDSRNGTFSSKQPVCWQSNYWCWVSFRTVCVLTIYNRCAIFPKLRCNFGGNCNRQQLALTSATCEFSTASLIIIIFFPVDLI